MSPRWFWFGFLALTLLLLVAVSHVLLPFVVGLMTAYFLDPAADWLQRRKCSRLCATSLITVLFFSVVALVVVLVVPVLLEQTMQLAAALPEYIAALEARYAEELRRMLVQFGEPDSTAMLRDAAQSISTTLLNILGRLVTEALQSGLALVNLFSLLFITPVVAFYLLKDWDVLVRKVDALLPVKHAETIRGLMREIDRVISAFVHGQTNVCLFLAVFYSIGLSIAGLQYGFALGLMTGILAVIPYAGAMFGAVTSLVLAFIQFDDLAGVAGVAAVFVAGQVIEGNFITPKLVGGKVGLHPVWLIFALLAGGTLFGFLGVLIAVPVAAVLGVLLRFGARHYLKSGWYLR